MDYTFAVSTKTLNGITRPADSRAEVIGGSNKKNFKKIFKLILIFLFLTIVGFGIFRFRKSFLAFKKNLVSEKQKEEEVLTSKTIALNKKFKFAGLTDEGKEKGEIELEITDIEKTNQVIVKDKNYTAKNEKLFLIVNLELKNETTDRLNIFPGDLIRLVINKNEEKKFAPDLHNSYVQVAPISTKIDRVGFIIDKNFNNLKLQVGKLEGDKEVLELNFST